MNTGWTIAGTIGAILLVLTLVFFRPVFGPWIQERKGFANLRQAEQERRILIEQAQAEKDAATLRAEAIQIVGQAAKDFPEYREQEYIGAFAEMLTQCRGQQLIYIPTEASIPVLEATRLQE